MTAAAGTAAPSHMPLGLMVSDYGENPADTVSSAGSVAAAGKRNFWVRKGDVVELLDIEDETWWLVRRCAEPEKAATGMYSEIQTTLPGSPRKLNQGWVPEQHVRVLARRPAGTAMVAGSADWRNTLRTRHESGEPKAAQASATEADADREVAKLIAYREIMSFRAEHKGIPTPLFLGEEWLDHPFSHCVAAGLLLAHAYLIAAMRPSALQLGLGLVTGFLAVDLLSTAYHLCLDYALLSSNTVTLTDLHHKLPLNYNLFAPRQLIATSYVAVLPMHALHLLMHALLAAAGCHAPTFAVHTGVAALLGCSCGFVHNAAHRRRHELPIHPAVWLLQNAGLLLHPDVHSAHHREAHDRNFSLFSGITHPLTDRLLQLAWKRGWMPRTPETARVKLS